MSDAPVVGSAAFELRASRKKLAEDIRASERDLKASMGQIERDADKGAKSIGASIGRMATVAVTAVTALVTVLGMAAAGALDLGLQGMRMADDMANTARKIGIGTDALQEWRHVTERTGGTARDADQALDKFSLKLAQASAGVKKDAVDAFNLIRLKPDQLKSFSSVEAALGEVIDRIRSLKSEADRIAAIEALGLGGLSPALKVARRVRDLAMFNCALDSKLRACDLVRLQVSDVVPIVRLSWVDIGRHWIAVLMSAMGREPKFA